MEDPAATVKTALDRGWFAGRQEAARVLSHLVHGEPGLGTAFGGAWPFVEGEGWLLTPGAPVVVREAPADGADGVYRVAGRQVLREAAGLEEPLLEMVPPSPQEGPPPPDLLWFGERERYLLRRGVLSIEDLFCRVVAPADSARIENLLVRTHRLGEAILDGLELGPGEVPVEVMVRRPVDLVLAAWRDPERQLLRREGVRTVDRRGEILTVTLEDGSEAAATVEETEAGWRVDFAAGGFPWMAAEARLEGEAVVYRAFPGPGLDPIDPGVRSRIAFDLMTDLLG